MTKIITLTNFKRKITSKEQKKIFSLAKAITSNKDSIITRDSEYPQKGICEIKFEVDIKDNKDLVYFLFYFLSFLQNQKFEVPSGEWYTLKCGLYLININEDGRNDPIVI